jgi:dihydrofolate reductase
VRTVVLSSWVSADGYLVEGGSPLMAFMQAITDAEHERYFVDRIASVGEHAMGSRTYREMSAFWPHSDDPVAEPMNRIPKLAFTRGEELEAGWGPVRIVRGEAAQGLASLKAEEGGDILVHGGTGFVHSLLRQGLIDEFRLNVLPVVVGAGMGLFDHLGHLQPLRLVSVRPFPSGVQEVVWQPLPAA